MLTRLFSSVSEGTVKPMPPGQQARSPCPCGADGDARSVAGARLVDRTPPSRRSIQVVGTTSSRCRRGHPRSLELELSRARSRIEPMTRAARLQARRVVLEQGGAGAAWWREPLSLGTPADASLADQLALVADAIRPRGPSRAASCSASPSRATSRPRPGGAVGGGGGGPRPGAPGGHRRPLGRRDPGGRRVAGGAARAEAGRRLRGGPGSA